MKSELKVFLSKDPKTDLYEFRNAVTGDLLAREMTIEEQFAEYYLERKAKKEAGTTSSKKDLRYSGYIIFD